MRRHSLRILVARGTAASRLWVGAIALLLVLGLGQRAAAEGIAPLGVPEDASGFEAPCNRGEVLTGIFLSSDGAEIVAASPQCASASNPGSKSQAVPEHWYGADPSSLGYESAACPDIAPVLLSIRVQTLTNVDSEIHNFRFFKLETFCGVDGSHPSLEQIGGSYATINIPGWQLGGGTQFCPTGQVAVGIHGRFQRSGEGLSELGLICGDARTGSRGMGGLSVSSQRIDTSGPVNRAVLSQPSSNLRVSPISRPINAGVARLVTPANAPAGPAVPPALQPPAVQPPVAQPPAEPGHLFMPPAFADRAQLWACASAAQADRRKAPCQGLRPGKLFCQSQGFSGALQLRADGSPDLTIAAARPGIPVRASNGDVCAANDCLVLSELRCAP